jgi:hypothetical protein
MEAIPLASMLGSALDPVQCKLHSAAFDGEYHPIDVHSERARLVVLTFGRVAKHLIACLEPWLCSA